MIFGILFFILLGWLLFRANTNRGQNFIRSFYFLLCLDNGKTVEEANNLARNILTINSDPDNDKRLIQMATDFSKENLRGKQLPIINEAASKGFVK